MTSKLSLGDIISWIFGIAVLAVGIINTFWGNDSGFGIFLILLSFVYLPPVNDIVRQRIGFKTPLVAKIVLGLLIAWASLGVGELFNKIALMRMDL